MTMPNFLIIGAQKSGTSSLYRYLKNHPQIFMPKVKEPKFFALESEDFGFNAPYTLPAEVARIADIDVYQALFQPADRETALGEASTWYLPTPGTAARIRHYVPDMKLIAILRQPVERAYSNFLHARNYLKIEPYDDFAQAIHAEESRKEQAWGHPWYYKHKGFYTLHLKPYFDTFDRRQIRVYLMDDLKSDPTGLLKDIYQFLNVDDSFLPDFAQRYNVSADSARSATLHNLLNKPSSVKSAIRWLIPPGMRRQMKLKLQKRNRAKQDISPEIRQELMRDYREDILKLQDLIGRDLSSWLS